MTTVDYGNFEIAYRDVGGVEPWEAYLVWWLGRRLGSMGGGLKGLYMAITIEMIRFFYPDEFGMYVAGGILVVETRDGLTVCSIRESVPGRVDS